MRGVKQRLVAQRHELLVNGVVEQPRVLACFFRIRKVRASRLSDEQRVTGKHAPGALGCVRHEYGVRHTLWGVTGCMQRAQTKFAEVEVFAVTKPDVAVTEKLVPTIDDLGARDPRNFGRAQHEVLLTVRLEHILDRQLVLTCALQVLIHVAARVYDDRFASIPQKIGGVGDTWSFDTLKKHADSNLLTRAAQKSVARAERIAFCDAVHSLGLATRGCMKQATRRPGWPRSRKCTRECTTAAEKGILSRDVSGVAQGNTCHVDPW